MISFSIPYRKCQKGIHKGRYSFDGLGGVLSHANFPVNDLCRDVHLDRSENWYLGYEDISEVPRGKIRIMNSVTH